MDDEHDEHLYDDCNGCKDNVTYRSRTLLDTFESIIINVKINRLCMCAL